MGEHGVNDEIFSFCDRVVASLLVRQRSERRVVALERDARGSRRTVLFSISGSTITRP